MDGLGWNAFKNLLADVIVCKLEPIQREYHNLMKEDDYINGVIVKGKLFAEAVAEETLRKVKEDIGLISSSTILSWRKY